MVGNRKIYNIKGENLYQRDEYLTERDFFILNSTSLKD